PGDQVEDGPAEDADGPRDGRGRFVGEGLEGGGEQRVPREDRGVRAEDAPGGRPVPAGEVAVHHVVVQEREVVRQLDRDGGGERGGGGPPDRLRREQGERRADRLAAGAGGGAAALVAPAEVERGDAADLLRHPLDGVPQGGVEQPAAPAEDLGRRAGAARQGIVPAARVRTGVRARLVLRPAVVGRQTGLRAELVLCMAGEGGWQTGLRGG